MQAKDFTITCILLILLGGLGIHEFYLGNNKEGIVCLICGIICYPLVEVIELWRFLDKYARNDFNALQNK